MKRLIHILPSVWVNKKHIETIEHREHKHVGKFFVIEMHNTKCTSSKLSFYIYKAKHRKFYEVIMNGVLAARNEA